MRNQFAMQMLRVPFAYTCTDDDQALRGSVGDKSGSPVNIACTMRWPDTGAARYLFILLTLISFRLFISQHSQVEIYT